MSEVVMRALTKRPIGRSGWRTAVAVVGLLSATSAAWACSVPVFRYAMERWAADSYPVYVFHEGELSAEDQALLERFQKNTAGTNIDFQVIDLREPLEDRVRVVWEKAQSQDETSTELPRIVAHTPPHFEVQAVILSGRLEEDTLSRIVDSPLRRELARRLLDGESAVWVLLESGNAEQDDEKAALLKSQLATLENTLHLPEQDAEPTTGSFPPQELDLGVEGELKIGFSLLRLSRDDPQEEALVNMLLASEPDLQEVEHTMVFPIFGRGRTLYALAGAGINDDLIQESCTFLIGPCSCQIKDQNPGADLLMAVRWEDAIDFEAVPEKELPPLVGVAGFTQFDDDTEHPSQQTQTAEEGAANSGNSPGGGRDTTVESAVEAVRAETEDGAEAAMKTGGAGGLGRNVLAVIVLSVLAVAVGTVFVTLHKKV